MQKFLVIQTAFIGDVVLATALAEKLHRFYPGAKIDFLVRKGNEALLQNNPCLNEVLIWDKKESKYKNLVRLIKNVRKRRYDYVINLQRFFATGLLTALSGSRHRTGFDKNPLSRFFTRKVYHEIGNGMHEVDRNLKLITDITDDSTASPRLYPSAADEEKIAPFTKKKFITITPSSVWFTKQYPVEKWVEFINHIKENYAVFLLGGKENIPDCEIIAAAVSKHTVVLAGSLSFLQSAALMKHAVMNFVNDSAPLHFASAMNAPVTAVFCSTVPAFGFYPLSDASFIVQTDVPLQCKPCGLHGYKACPLGHFKCAYTIRPDQLTDILPHDDSF